MNNNMILNPHTPTPLDPYMHLSPHFTLGEMTRSGTATKLGIDNTPTAEDIDRMRLLCRRTLEPIRRQMGRLMVNSGYRSELLNKAVGGARNSQHTRGEAADLYCKDLDTAQRMMVLLSYGYIPFDQFIIEQKLYYGVCWVHVSYRGKRYGLENRGEIINERGHLTRPMAEWLHECRLRWAWQAQHEATEPQAFAESSHISSPYAS